MAELAKWAGIAGTALSVAGPIYAGSKASDAAGDEAEQLRRRAGARRGEAQRAAAEERRQNRFARSRAQAVIASQGGSLADPGAVNYMGDLEAEGEYAALARLYEGYDEAEGLDAAARARRREGKAARTAGYLRGFTNALMGVETLRSKYGST